MAGGLYFHSDRKRVVQNTKPYTYLEVLGFPRFSKHIGKK
jgi:hypothetical protein